MDLQEPDKRSNHLWDGIAHLNRGAGALGDPAFFSPLNQVLLRHR